MKHCIGGYAKNCVETDPTHIIHCMTPEGIHGTITFIENEEKKTIKQSEARGFKNSNLNSEIQEILPEIQQIMEDKIQSAKYPSEKNQNRRSLIQEYIRTSSSNQMTQKMFRWYCARRWQIWKRILPELPDLPDVFFSKTYERPMVLFENQNNN